SAKSGGTVGTYALATGAAANLPTATTELATARDADAVTLFGVGSTYAGLNDTDKATVDTTGATTSGATGKLAAYTTAVTGAGLVAAADYAEGLADTVAATSGTWGGRDTYNGLVITSQLGDANNGADIAINNAAVGDMNAKVIGDVQILGLMLGKSKIVIMGH
ncbi:MAG TPA: hypothetical protein PK212_01235, partial [Agitococcus sp.]|nr:hypothetical protein [Agitococcus sp.]